MKRFVKLIKVVCWLGWVTGFCFGVGGYAQSNKRDATRPDTAQVMAMIRLARRYAQADSDSANYYSQAAFQLAERLRDSRTWAECWFERARYFQIHENKSQAIEACQKALRDARRSKDKNLIGTVLYRRGQIEEIPPIRPDSIVQYYLQARRYYKASQNKQNEIRLLLEIARAEAIFLGQLDSARVYLFEALQLSEKPPVTPELLGEALQNIGFFYIELQNPAAALNYLRRAEDVVTQCGDLIGAANCQYSISQLYSERLPGKYDSVLTHHRGDTALVYAQKSYANFLKAGNPIFAAQPLMVMGNIYEARSDFGKRIALLDSARRAYQRALELSPSYLVDQRALAYLFLAGVEVLASRSQIALRLLDEVEALNGGSLRRTAQIYQLRGRAYAQVGDFQAAYRARKAEEKAKDVYLSEAHIAAREKTQERFEQAIRHEREEYARKRDRQTLQTQKRKSDFLQYLVVLIGVSSLVFWSVVLLRYRRRSRTVVVLSFVSLLLLTELIIVIGEDWLANATENTPFQRLIFNLSVAVLVTPLFSWLESFKARKA